MTDRDLAPGVGLVVWTPELLSKAVLALTRYGLKYDSSVLGTPTELAQRLLERAPITYAIGTGGIALFDSLQPGVNAVAHVFLWSYRYFNRPYLLRAICRDAFRRWHLQRITGVTPSRHKAALRNAVRVGFVQEGVIRRALRYTGGVDDSVIFGLLPEEVGLPWEV